MVVRVPQAVGIQGNTNEGQDTKPKCAKERHLKCPSEVLHLVRIEKEKGANARERDPFLAIERALAMEEPRRRAPERALNEPIQDQ